MPSPHKLSAQVRGKLSWRTWRIALGCDTSRLIDKQISLPAHISTCNYATFSIALPEDNLMTESFQSLVGLARHRYFESQFVIVVSAESAHT